MKNIKTEIKYAIYSVIALVIWVMAEHFLGFNTNKMQIGQYTEPCIAIIVLLFLFLGIREKCNKDFNGRLTLRQGIITAFYISFFYAILQGLWFAFYSHVINPEYAALTFSFKEKQLTTEGKTPQQILDELAVTKMIFGNVLLQFLFFLSTTTLIDTIVGVVFTLFLKYKANKRPDARTVT